MADGGVISAFRFESFKVDRVKLDAKQHLETLSLDYFPKESWRIKLNLRVPAFFTLQNIYVGGLDIVAFLLNENGIKEVEEKNTLTPSDENVLVRVEAGIAGVFSVENGKLEKEIESSLVKVQIPALLLPYIRGTMTSLVANAGFGSLAT